jgi:DNA primase
LLRNLTDTILPDSQELADEVAQSVRVMEIKEYGKDRLPAGPAIEDSDEIIVVEGRADVLNLLKQGIKNSIALNGTSVPQTIKDLSKQKIVTAFVDGDRGGDLIIRELMNVAEIDFVCKAPDGKEVEEITKKEIHKALRGKVAAEQAKMDISSQKSSNGNTRFERKKQFQPRRIFTRPAPPTAAPIQKRVLTVREKDKFKSSLEDLFGTRGAYLLDNGLNVLGKVPVTELRATVKSVNNVFAMVLDGPVDRDLVRSAETAGVKYVVSMESRVKNGESRVQVLTDAELS